jgi:cell division protein FtsW (lipid II flippase)
VYPSFKFTSRLVARGDLTEIQNYYYLVRNISHVILGIGILVFMSKVPYTWLEKYTKKIFLTCLFFLFIVLFIGKKLNGATGWIDIPGVPFALQPVEFMKIGIILMLAYFMKRNRFLLSDFYRGFIPFFTIVAIVFGLLALQPDFGSVLIIAPVVVLMYYIGGGSGRSIAYASIFCMIGALGIYGLGHITMENAQ